MVRGGNFVATGGDSAALKNWWQLGGNFTFSCHQSWNQTKD